MRPPANAGAASRSRIAKATWRMKSPRRRRAGGRGVVPKGIALSGQLSAQEIRGGDLLHAVLAEPDDRQVDERDPVRLRDRAAGGAAVLRPVEPRADPVDDEHAAARLVGRDRGALGA